MADQTKAPTPREGGTHTGRAATTPATPAARRAHAAAADPCGRRATIAGVAPVGGRAAAAPLGVVTTRTGYYTRGVRARGADAVRVERVFGRGVGSATKGAGR